MNYIIAAILANISYAFADNGNGLVAKKNSPLKVVLWTGIFGLVIFLIPMFLFFGDEIHRLNTENMAWILGTGVIVSLGYFSFITGMSKGSVTLTGVIGGSFPVVTTLVALLFFNEHVSLLEAFAVVCTLLGVVLSSLEGSIKTLLHDIRTSALIYAFGTFFLWGIYYAVVRIPVEQVGWFLPQYGTILIDIPLVLLVAWFSGERKLMKRPKLPWLIALVSVLQIGGSMFYNYAITQGDTAIVAPIAGSSPAVFAMLAFFIFKERLKTIQIVGVIITITGIIGLSFLGS